MKVGIAWPHTMPYYHKLFTERMFCMYRPRGEFQLLIPNCDGPLDSVRNELCQQALITECTHIFWADTDQTYPEDTLIKLLDHNLPIVCAKVHRRKAPYDPLLKRVNPDKQDKQNPYIDVEFDEWAMRDDPKKLICVDATGFGCNLMWIEVIENIKPPWFMFDLYQKPVVGEDFYFWAKAREAGYQIFVDCSINVGHISTAVVDMNVYKHYRNSVMG